MQCNVCHLEEAQIDPVFGVLPGVSCTERMRSYQVSKTTVEVIPESLKEERKVYRKDILQPFREGKLSKEYLKEYGDKTIKVSEREKRQAQSVWTEGVYYHED